LSRISQPHFHRELFTLILYNMHMKQQMVRTASFRCRSNVSVATLGKELTIDDVSGAIASPNRNSHSRYHRGRQLLNTVDSVAQSVPHSSEAAKRALRVAEAHQHKFGLSSYFASVAPDDNNSFIVQIFAYRPERPTKEQS